MTKTQTKWVQNSVEVENELQLLRLFQDFINHCCHPGLDTTYHRREIPVLFWFSCCFVFSCIIIVHLPLCSSVLKIATEVHLQLWVWLCSAKCDSNWLLTVSFPLLPVKVFLGLTPIEMSLFQWARDKKLCFTRPVGSYTTSNWLVVTSFDWKLANTVTRANPSTKHPSACYVKHPNHMLPIRENSLSACLPMVSVVSSLVPSLEKLW